MPYVCERWLGGMLTNFTTIKKSIDRLNYLDRMFGDESINAFPKKEILKLQKNILENPDLSGINTEDYLINTEIK